VDINNTLDKKNVRGIFRTPLAIILYCI